MKAKKSTTPKRDPKLQAYDMLDEPVVNPRYRNDAGSRDQGVEAPETENPAIKGNYSLAYNSLNLDTLSFSFPTRDPGINYVRKTSPFKIDPADVLAYKLF